MEQKKLESRIDYCTPKQIADDEHLCFTLPMVRYYILHAHKNGLAPAIRRIGKKILIRRDLFLDWIESHKRKVGK